MRDQYFEPADTIIKSCSSALINFNSFLSLDVVSHYRGPQLQVTEIYLGFVKVRSHCTLNRLHRDVILLKSDEK